MLLFIWTCVMMQAFMPGVDTIVAMQARAYEDHLRAQIEAPQPTSALFGAAGHVVRYQMPKLSAA